MLVFIYEYKRVVDVSFNHILLYISLLISNLNSLSISSNDMVA